MPEPFKKLTPITENRNGRIYYLMKTPLEGFTESKANQFKDTLIKEEGYRDAFVKRIRGFHYVYGDPGYTPEEVDKIVRRFTLIENAQSLIDHFKWATFREKSTGEVETWFHVVCEHCGYQWKTQSKMNLVTCPSCGFKTPRNLPGGGAFLTEER